MIELKQVTAGYGGAPVIRDISLTFRPGEVLVLLGPNGSGKSTLIKTALGLIPVTSGSVLCDGCDIRSLSPKEMAKKASYLTQERNIPEITAGKMVLHGRYPYRSFSGGYTAHDRELARKAMEETETIPYEQVSVCRLSGGQRQGVYLAMTMAQAAQTVFMDEPTTFLDIAGQLRLLRRAKELAKQGAAVVLILHDLPLAMAEADRIAVMEEGRLRYLGDPDAFVNSGLPGEIFGVGIYRTETVHGIRYYCAAGEE